MAKQKKYHLYRLFKNPPDDEMSSIVASHVYKVAKLRYRWRSLLLPKKGNFSTVYIYNEQNVNILQ